VYLEIPRDVLDREVDIAKAVIPSRASTAPRPARSAIRATSRSWPTFSSMPSGRRFSTASRCGRRAATSEAIALLRGLDIPGYFNGASRGLLPPGDPHHFDRTRGRPSRMPT
jgi:acetolactate synthase-1/2/3 large subunit